MNRENPSKTDRSRNDCCPCCLDKLERINKETRKQRVCHRCHSCLAKELKGQTCHKHQIWRGKKGQYCNNCGNEFILYKPK